MLSGQQEWRVSGLSCSHLRLLRAPTAHPTLMTPLNFGKPTSQWLTLPPRESASNLLTWTHKSEIAGHNYKQLEVSVYFSKGKGWKVFWKGQIHQSIQNKCFRMSNHYLFWFWRQTEIGAKIQTFVKLILLKGFGNWRESLNWNYQLLNWKVKWRETSN